GEAGIARRFPAAAIAMHYAEAGDCRTFEWALRAAAAARSVDAHGEALTQFERALAFALTPERRREVFIEVAVETNTLGRFAESRRAAEAGLAQPGGEPETIARLHQLAARACLQVGDRAADEAHLVAAERILAGRPVSVTAAHVAVAQAA